jgi:hypothetical protein
MPSKEDLVVVLGKLSNFIGDTLSDFVSCWRIYPNVLIWCGVAFLIAAFV